MKTYWHRVAAGLLEEHSCPAGAIDDWNECETNSRWSNDRESMHWARRLMQGLFQPRMERTFTMLLLAGETGTGKTVSAIAALGDTLAKALLLQKSNSLLIDRPSTPSRNAANVVTPDRVRKVIGVDWATWSVMTRMHPGVYEREVLDAYAQESGWDYDACPVSFVFWDAAKVWSSNFFAPEIKASIEIAKTCDVLIIDDLGSETMSESGMWLSVLNDVVNQRYQNRLLTIFTANMTWVRFVGRYQRRIADRINEFGMAYEDGGPSLRVKRMMKEAK